MKVIGLPLVIGTRQDLQIRRHVQAAYESTTDRDDVVDFVPDTGLLRQAQGFGVDGPDRIMVSPCRRGLKLHRIAFGDKRVDPRWISFRPSAVIVAMLFDVVGAPLSPIRSFMLSVLDIPLRVGRWMIHLPYSGSLTCAIEACERQTISGRTSLREQRKRLDLIAHVAGLKSLLLEFCDAFALLPEQRVAVVGMAFSASGRHTMPASTAPPSSGPAVFAEFGDVFTDVAFRAGLSHLAAMCWSMMRLTSSAIEIPSLLASRMRNCLCGMVNEIICLTMPYMIPQGITGLRTV